MQPAERQWLDEALGRLAAEAALPVAPDIAAAVQDRLGRRRGPVPVRTWVLRAAVVAVLALVAAAIGVSASRDAREAVADFLGLAVRGERIEIVSPTVTNAAGTQAATGTSGTRTATATPTPTPTPTPGFEGLAEPVSLEEAAARMSFAIVVPPGAEVEEVFVLDFLGLEGVVLRTAEYDLWEFRNDRGQFLGKGIYGAEQVQPVRVRSVEGYWVTGGPRVLEGRDADGNSITGVQVFTDVQALIWPDGAVTFRLEGDMPLEEAVAIAESLP